MKSLDVFEQIGVLLLGFSIYDAVYNPWKFFGGEASQHFGWTHALLVLLFCAMIAVALSISHHANNLAFSEGVTIGRSRLYQRVHRATAAKPFMTSLGVVLSLGAIALAYFGLGGRQAFLLWIGFGFVNFGPLATSMLART